MTVSTKPGLCFNRGGILFRLIFEIRPLPIRDPLKFNPVNSVNAVNSVNPVNPVNPVNAVNQSTQPPQNIVDIPFLKYYFRLRDLKTCLEIA